METPAKLIRKASRLPIGNSERRAILANLSDLDFFGFKHSLRIENDPKGFRVEGVVDFFSPQAKNTEAWESFIGRKTSGDWKKEGFAVIKTLFRDIAIEKIFARFNGLPNYGYANAKLIVSAAAFNTVYGSQGIRYLFDNESDAKKAIAMIITELNQQKFPVKSLR